MNRTCAHFASYRRSPVHAPEVRCRCDAAAAAGAGGEADRWRDSTVTGPQYIPRQTMPSVSVPAGCAQLLRAISVHPRCERCLECAPPTKCLGWALPTQLQSQIYGRMRTHARPVRRTPGAIGAGNNWLRPLFGPLLLGLRSRTLWGGAGRTQPAASMRRLEALPCMCRVRSRRRA